MPDENPHHWQRLHPSFLLFELGGLLRRFLLPAVLGGTAAVQMDSDPRNVLLVMAGVSCGLLLARYLTFRYALTDAQITIEEGLLHRRKREIPLQRINHVETRDNPLARWLQVTQLQLLPEGTGAPEAALPAVSLAEAERIAGYVRRHNPAQGSEQSSRPRTQPIFESNGAATLRAGATAFNLWVLFGILAVLQVNARRYVDEGTLTRIFGDALESTTMAIGNQPGLIWLIAIGAAAIVLLAINLALAYVRWWRYSVERVESEIEIRSGFLARAHTRINDERIHGIRVYSNPLRRLLDLAEIAVVAPRQDQQRAQRSSVVIPIAGVRQVDGYLSQIWPVLNSWVFEPVPVDGYHRRAQLNRWILSVAATACGAVVLIGPALPAAAALALGLLGWWITKRNAALTGYQLADEFLAVRTLGIGRSLWIVPRDHVQGLIIRESIFQRRRDVATLELDINGLKGRILVPDIKREHAESMRENLLATVVP